MYVGPSIPISIKLFSETIHGNDLKLGMMVQYDKLYVLSNFQVCRNIYFLFGTKPISKSMLINLKISVKLFSETVQWNDLILGRMIQYDKLYVLSDFQVCWTSTSCLGLGRFQKLKISIQFFSETIQGDDLKLGRMVLFVWCKLYVLRDSQVFETWTRLMWESLKIDLKISFKLFSETVK